MVGRAKLNTRHDLGAVTAAGHKKKLETINSTKTKLIEDMMMKFKNDNLGHVSLIAKSTYPMMVTTEKEKMNLKQFSRKYKHKYQEEKE